MGGITVVADLGVVATIGAGSLLFSFLSLSPVLRFGRLSTVRNVNRPLSSAAERTGIAENIELICVL